MLQGFRWQLVALLTAASLFAISLLVRSGDTPAMPTPLPDVATEVSAQATALPTDIPANPQATAPPRAAQDGDGVATYREALVGSVQRLNPLFAPLNTVDRDITSLIFEGLTETNAYGEPQALLARDWTISSDGLEYTVRLRDDVLWQDGIPFSADDVIYTMAVLRAPDFPGPTELGEFWRTVETEKLGDHLVRFRLTQRLGRFLDMLRIGILPAHALQGTGAAQLASHPFNLSPIGTGPYQLEALRVSSNNIAAVDLRVAPNYRQRPEGQTGFALDRVRFILYSDFAAAREALAQGQVDALVAGERQERRPLLNISGVVPYTQIQPDLGIIIFNWANPDTAFFREQRLRVALEVGVDRSSVVERNLLNEAVRADSPIMPGSWAYMSDLPWPPHNPSEARDLLGRAYERALETAPQPTAEPETAADVSAESTESTEATEAPAPPPSNTLFDFEILAPDDPALTRMAQEIANQWSQYGLGVTVATADEATFQARLESGDFDAALVELSLGDSADPDVYEFWHEGQYGAGKNYGGAADRRVSEALEKARQEISGVNRVVFYQQFQHDFVDRAIAIPMYYPLFTYAVADDVQGVQLGFIGTPADRFRNIQDWLLFRE